MFSPEARDNLMSQIHYLTWLTEKEKAARLEFMQYAADLSDELQGLVKLLRSADDTPKQANMENVDETQGIGYEN